ncbi:hypothetical protein F2Q70_00039317 [Brassica cretica]|uniref:Malectin-like domain-containing protein n=1 Tax=Brassica cretica TaxID=69181 RepID=A0A8S9K1R9_BRACR|nr:hypothetical protein F2Q70_00039317 [Brassica cretica]
MSSSAPVSKLLLIVCDIALLIVSIDMNSPTKDIWTFVSGPEAVYNPEVFYEPGARFEPGGHLGTRRFLLDPKVILNLEVVWEPGDPEVVLNPGLYKNSEVYLFQALISFQDPETAWAPEGTVLRLPRQDNSRYLFGFRILPLGSWPLSSSYAVFYFCRKSLTGLEGAGVGVMTQVLGFAAFHVWRSRVLIAPCSLPESNQVSSSGSTLHYMQYLALYVRIPHGSRLLSRSTIFDRVGVENGYDEVNVQIPAEYKPATDRSEYDDQNTDEPSSVITQLPHVHAVRSLRSDRARANLGRYVATKHPLLSVATYRPSSSQARYLRSDRASRWTLGSDQARAMLGRYVATERPFRSVAT